MSGRTGALVQRRPAESSAVAGAVALLIARALGVDDAATITALAIVIAFIPTLVTTLVVWRRKGAASAAPPPAEPPGRDGV